MTHGHHFIRLYGTFMCIADPTHETKINRCRFIGVMKPKERRSEGARVTFNDKVDTKWFDRDQPVRSMVAPSRSDIMSTWDEDDPLSRQLAHLSKDFDQHHQQSAGGVRQHGASDVKPHAHIKCGRLHHSAQQGDHHHHSLPVTVLIIALTVCIFWMLYLLFQPHDRLYRKSRVHKTRKL